MHPFASWMGFLCFSKPHSFKMKLKISLSGTCCSLPFIFCFLYCRGLIAQDNETVTFDLDNAKFSKPKLPYILPLQIQTTPSLYES